MVKLTNVIKLFYFPNPFHSKRAAILWWLLMGKDGVIFLIFSLTHPMTENFP